MNVKYKNVVKIGPGQKLLALASVNYHKIIVNLPSPIMKIIVIVHVKLNVLVIINSIVIIVNVSVLITVEYLLLLVQMDSNLTIINVLVLIFLVI